MTTIYRGYDIRKGISGYWVYKGDQQASEKAFKSEEAAQDAIDAWKREQIKREG